MPNTPLPTTPTNTSYFETNRHAVYNHQYAVYRSTPPRSEEETFSSFKIGRHPLRTFITHPPQPPRILKEAATQPIQQNRIDSSSSYVASSLSRRQEHEDVFATDTNPPLLLSTLSRSSGSGRTPSPFIFESYNETSVEKSGVPIPIQDTSAATQFTHYLSPSSLPLRQSTLPRIYLSTTSSQPPPAAEKSFSLRSSRIPVPLRNVGAEVKRNELVKNELIAEKLKITKYIKSLQADLSLAEAWINMSQANSDWLNSRMKDLSSEVITRENNKVDLSRVDAALTTLNGIKKDPFINNQVSLLLEYSQHYRNIAGELEMQQNRLEQIGNELLKYQ